MLRSTLTFAMLCAAASATPIMAQTIGFFDLSIPASHHEGMSLTGRIWYPTDDPSAPSIQSENAIFQGVMAIENARMPTDPHPTILLSHGMGGGVHSVAWMGHALAQKGAVVITVNHINSTYSARDAVKIWHHWTRAQDLSAALDHALAMPTIAGMIDADHISAVGFSYGGGTALALGGLTQNRDGFLGNCDQYEDFEYACDVINANLATMPEDTWNASYKDDRVSSVVAIDPGFVWGLSEPDVQALPLATTIIQLGNAKTQMRATNSIASGLAALLSNARIETIPNAIHFTAMPLCKPAGWAILAATFDDTVCTDPKGTNRAEVHRTIIEIIAQTMKL